jgi:hypothetical protein
LNRTGLKEGIGLAIDRKNNRAFVSDLGGFVRVMSPERPDNGKIVFQVMALHRNFLLECVNASVGPSVLRLKPSMSRRELSLSPAYLAG